MNIYIYIYVYNFKDQKGFMTVESAKEKDSYWRFSIPGNSTTISSFALENQKEGAKKYFSCKFFFPHTTTTSIFFFFFFFFFLPATNQ